MDTEDVKTAVVQLERLTYGGEMTIPNHVMQGLAIKPEVTIQRAVTGLLLQVRGSILKQKLDTIVFSAPSDWWQHFKKRWFPDSWLRRWPVKNRTEVYEIMACYPDIGIPEHEHFVTWRRVE